MGSSAEIFDMIGFSCISFKGNLCYLDIELEEEEGCDDLPEEFAEICDKLKELGVTSIMTDRVTASEPMAIGWSTTYGTHIPSQEEIDSLRTILKEAGLKPVRLEKDRFISYG